MARASEGPAGLGQARVIMRLQPRPGGQRNPAGDSYSYNSPFRSKRQAWGDRPSSDPKGSDGRNKARRTGWYFQKPPNKPRKKLRASKIRVRYKKINKKNGARSVLNFKVEIMAEVE